MEYRFGLLLTALTVALWGLPAAPVAAEAPIKIGFIYSFSGTTANYGGIAKQGAKLAIDEINAQGGLNGRKLTGVFADSRLDPTVGVREAKRLVNEEMVDVVMGIVSSGVAKAVAPVLNDLRKPLIITLAMTPDVTGGTCNPYTFRVSLNGPQNMSGAAMLASEFPCKKWTTIGPDYIFGYQCWEYFQKYLRSRKPDVAFCDSTEVAYAPVTTQDFAPFIKKIMSGGADGVLVSLYGGDLVTFVHQANAMGLFSGKIKVLMNLAYSTDVLQGLSWRMPEGVWLGGLYWHQANQSETNKRFVQAYRTRYSFPPDHNAHGAYSGVMAYAAAVKKAGSADTHEVVKALEGLVVDLPCGEITLRAEDHQAVCCGVWGKTAGLDPRLRMRTLQPLRVFPGIDITRPVEDTGCTLAAPRVSRAQQ